MTQGLYRFTLAMLFAGSCNTHIIPAQNTFTPKNGKTLVPFSTRQKNPTESSFLQKHWGEESLDLSYHNRPDIITLDRPEASNPVFKNVHIVADATKPIPSIPNVTQLYCERPVTLETIDGKEVNIIHIYLKNLLTVLPDNHPVLIEWDPYLVLSWPYASAKPEELAKDLRIKNEHNPFSGHFDGRACILNVQCALGLAQAPEHISDDAKQESGAYQGAINGLLSMLAKSLPIEHSLLENRLALEVKIIKLANENHPSNIYTPKDLSLSLETMKNHVDFIVIEKRNVHGVYTYKGIDLEKNKVKILKNGFKRDKYTMFLKDSTLFNFIWSNIAVGTNCDACIACLEQTGLYNVTLTQGTSPVNGRKNVYLLRGFKRPVSTLISNAPMTTAKITDMLINAATMIPNPTYQEKALKLAQRLHSLGSDNAKNNEDDEQSLEKQD